MRSLLLAAALVAAPAPAMPVVEMIRLGPIAEIKSDKSEDDLQACIAEQIGWSKHLEAVRETGQTIWVPQPPNAPVLKMVAGDPLFVFVTKDEGEMRTAKLYNKKGKGWTKFAEKFSRCGSPAPSPAPAAPQ